jgi:hypothetical protein
MHRMVTISDSHGATQVGPGLATCGQWHWATTVTRHAAQCPLPATGSAAGPGRAAGPASAGRDSAQHCAALTCRLSS